MTGLDEGLTGPLDEAKISWVKVSEVVPQQTLLEKMSIVLTVFHEED